MLMFPCNFIEIALRHGVSPVNLQQFSEHLFLRRPLKVCKKKIQHSFIQSGFFQNVFSNFASNLFVVFFDLLIPKSICFQKHYSEAYSEACQHLRWSVCKNT